MRQSMVIGCLGLMLVLGACEPPPANNRPTGAEEGGNDDLTPASSTVKGKILFEGTAPAPKPVQTTADKKCPQGGVLKSEEVVVSDGGLENVIVYVSSGAEGKRVGSAPSEASVVDQSGCRYVPHIFTTQVGQEVKIRNSDDTAHNIHSLSEKNPSFNFVQPVKGSESSQKFSKVETFKLKCEIHPWMAAIVGVFDNPFYTVSGKGGEYEIKLPPGKYEVTATHEKFGNQTATVEVKDGAVEPLNFTFKAAGK